MDHQDQKPQLDQRRADKKVFGLDKQQINGGLKENSSGKTKTHFEELKNK